MKTPRDIDAELKALAEKTRGLKARRILQLGELVALTGADRLDLETLAGALLAAVDSAKNTDSTEAWRTEGAAFFQRRARKKSKAAPAGAEGDEPGANANHGGDKAD